MESPVRLHSFIASFNISLKAFPFLNLEIIFIAGIFLCVIIIFIPSLNVHITKASLTQAHHECRPTPSNCSVS